MGDQVNISYGTKCNSKFFLCYGFINLPNEANEVSLVVSIDESDPIAYDAKLKLIDGGQPSREFRVGANLDS